MNVAALPASGVHSALRTRQSGLERDEVEERLGELGPNVLRAPMRFSWPRALAKQLTNFFTLLLNASALLCFVADALSPGESMDVLGAALFGVSALNALFSFVQEYRAEKAMEALRAFLPPRVTVRPGGQETTVLAQSLVPGDVLLLAEGDRIPADARIVSEHKCLVSNAPLTGESRPVAPRPALSTGACRTRRTSPLPVARCCEARPRPWCSPRERARSSARLPR